MADYITTDQFKTRHGITHNNNDERIASHISAASREVDAMCGRRFDGDIVASTRVFRPTRRGLLWIDDAWEITAVAVDSNNNGSFSTTWQTTDWQTEPLNGVGPNGQSGWPVEMLAPVGGYTFTQLPIRPAVRVTAKWGWAAVPADVVEATHFLANRLYYEVSVPSGTTPPNIDFGLAGSPLQRPYTVERLLAPYLKQVAIA